MLINPAAVAKIATQTDLAPAWSRASPADSVVTDNNKNTKIGTTETIRSSLTAMNWPNEETSTAVNGADTLTDATDPAATILPESSNEVSNKDAPTTDPVLEAAVIKTSNKASTSTAPTADPVLEAAVIKPFKVPHSDSSTAEPVLKAAVIKTSNQVSNNNAPTNDDLALKAAVTKPFKVPLSNGSTAEPVLEAAVIKTSNTASTSTTPTADFVLEDTAVSKPSNEVSNKDAPTATADPVLEADVLPKPSTVSTIQGILFDSKSIIKDYAHTGYAPSKSCIGTCGSAGSSQLTKGMATIAKHLVFMLAMLAFVGKDALASEADPHLSWAIESDLGEQATLGCDVEERDIGWCTYSNDCPYSGYPASDCEETCPTNQCPSAGSPWAAGMQCYCMFGTSTYTFFHGDRYVCATVQFWPDSKRTYPPNVSGFRCKGAGECRDSEGYSYAQIVYGSRNSYEECGVRCLQLDTEHLRGFTYHSNRLCHCLYDRNHLPSGGNTLSDFRYDNDSQHMNSYSGRCNGNCGEGEVEGTSAADIANHRNDRACFGFRQADVGNGQCMAGTTGFTKVEKLSEDSDVTTSTVTELQNLQVGDVIKGLDATKSPSDECEVVSVSSQGSSVVHGNYTNDHYVLHEDGDLKEHGSVGESQEAEVFQVLSSCPLALDESGKKSTFSICGESLYAGQSMPWNVYIHIHSVMFNIVKTSGIRDVSALRDADYAALRLPELCASGVQCAESGTCNKFELDMQDFIDHELNPDAREKALKAFPLLGYASKPGSVSHLISKGKSSNLRSGKKTLQQLE